VKRISAASPAAPQTTSPVGARPAVAIAGEETVQLSPFEVTASSNVGYGATTTASSSRLNERYIDVPQIVNVVTAEFMRDAKLFDSREALKYTNGVIPLSNAHDPGFIIRGLRSASTFVDGFRLAGGPAFIDTAFYDRLELVKGPSAATFGRGDPAGMINYITKRPNRRDRTAATVTFGTEDVQRYEVDNEGAINKERGLYYRLVGLYHAGATPKELSDSERGGYMLSLLWEPASKLRFTNINTFQSNKMPGDVGEYLWSSPVAARNVEQILRSQGNNNLVIVPRHLDPKQSVSFKGQQIDSEFFANTTTAEYTFNEVFSTRQAFRFDSQKRDADQIFPNVFYTIDTAGNFINTGRYNANISDAQQIRYQGDFLAQYKFLGASHKTLLGLEHFRSWTDTIGYALNPATTQNIYAINQNRPQIVRPAPNTKTYAKGEGSGIYLQQQSSWWNERILTSLAWRVDQFEGSSKNLLTGVNTPTPEDDNGGTPRVALTVKPLPSLSVYGLYGEHKDPSSLQFRFSGLPAGDPLLVERLEFQPTTRLKEVGAKGTFFEEKLTASMSYFETTRRGTVVSTVRFRTQPDGSTLQYSESTVSGETVRGVEFEVFGQPIKGLTLYGGYSRARGSQPFPGSSVLTPLSNAPDTLTLHARYDLHDAKGNGLSFSAGGKYLFGGWDYHPRTDVQFEDAQYLIDLGMGYGWANGRYSLDLRVNNVTDEFVLLNDNSAYPFRQAYLAFSVIF
jgi:iron complex outermembrane recepter protein